LSIDLANYKQASVEATKTFWKTRLSAKENQQATGKADQGERSSVTAGKNMDGFLNLMINVVKANGLPNFQIHVQRKVLTLPGYFRPTKLWDLLITHNDHLIAAIELKSHVGPSFGNNFNNRCEEAIGTAHDFATAYREGAFGDCTSPFTGYPVFSEYHGASYADRYNILCRKLIQEKLYTAASVITSPRTAIDTGEYEELSALTGLKTFVTELAAHVAKESTKS